MSAEAITRALGGRWHGSYGTACCPAHEDRNPSLSLRDGDDGRLLAKCWAGCDFAAVLAALQWRGLVDDDDRRGGGALPEVRRQAASDEHQRIAWALRWWAEAQDPRGSVVERYLARRGLALEAGVSGAALRFHPTMGWNGGRTPGMVALLRDLRSDRPCGVIRTFLSPDGSKLERRMLGRAKNAAVKLDGDDEVTLGLCVAEGVESALAGRALGFRPCWALGSASAIAAMPVLPGIEALTILGEVDESGANARAVEACAARWIAGGAEVSVVEPDAGDMLDVHQARVQR